MRSRYLLAAVLASLAVVGNADFAISQSEPTPTSSKPPAPPDAKDQLFKPGLDDLMTMLIQPRHIRLYYAGKLCNWELAAFQVQGLRSAFDRIRHVIPKYLGGDVDEAVSSIMAPKLQMMDAAIAAADSRQFAKAYEKLTDACNACHGYMEHSFLVIKVPSAVPDSMYADQDFSGGDSCSQTR